MTKAIALIALSLSLEAAFLFQISVIARPEPQGAVMAVAHAKNGGARVSPAAEQLTSSHAGKSPVAQSHAPALPRS